MLRQDLLASAALPAGYVGPPVDDLEIFERLPSALRSLLRHRNGFVSPDGALHVRGACVEPRRHALRTAWLGEGALHRRFPGLGPEDVPLAASACGDEFVLRGRKVLRLRLATGAVEDPHLRLGGLLRLAERDPLRILSSGGGLAAP